MKINGKMVFASLLAICCQARAVTVSNVQADQDWPWSDRIRVSYTLSGVTEAVGVEVSLFDGETALDSSLANTTLNGDFVGLSTNGDYSLTFACTNVFDGTRRLISGFKVRLSPTSLHPGYHFPLYKVYNLANGTCDDVTPVKLLSGAYGSCKWVDETAVGVAKNPLTNLVWTGVAADDKYRTTHLVMRYLAAQGDYVYKLGYKTDMKAMPADFYIAVFETTQAQWVNVTGDSHTWKFSDVQGRKPVDNVSYNLIRGTAAVVNDVPQYYYPQSPDSNSFLGKLRTKTGGMAFDLPAQFEWNYAWHALSAPKSLGTSADLPAEWSDGTSYADCEPPAQYKKTKTVGTAIVGSYAPSKAGLFDMYGNVCEWCADYGCEKQSGWRSWPAISNVDPNDPTAVASDSGASASYRPIFGGSYYTSSKSDLLLNGGDARGMKTPGTTSYKVEGDLGFRVVTPCSGTLGAAVALADTVSGDSAPFEVFSRAGDTYTWRTAPPGDFTVSWTFPEGASSATLLVEGVGYSQTFADVPTNCIALSLPAAAEGSENVYTLTLTFDNGKVATASLGRIRGAVAGNAATIRYVAPGSRSWGHASRLNVFTVPPGENLLAVDGGDAETVVGAGYHAWTCPDYQSHELVLSVGEEEPYTATLRLQRGSMIIVW